jgi:transaldolase
MEKVSDLKIKLFADGADLAGMLEMYEKPYIQGLTTNPTLMRKAGITDYRKFAQEVLKHVKTKPISFEVFSDDLEEMERQALEISTWGNNVYVKIPITNTESKSTEKIVENLVRSKVKVNVTALMTVEQVSRVSAVLGTSVPSYVSVFAGRIADTGRDPLEIMSQSLKILSKNPASELIWASPRELLNVFQANHIGCHVITATNDILKKLDLIGYDLDRYSLDTVKMFRNDALDARFEL